MILSVPSPFLALLIIPSNTSFPTELIVVSALSYPLYDMSLFNVIPSALRPSTILSLEIFEIFNCFDVLLSTVIFWCPVTIFISPSITPVESEPSFLVIVMLPPVCPILYK